MLQSIHTVSLEEIGNRADEIASELEAGRVLRLLKNGKRIAEIVPCAPEVSAEVREAARKELLAIMDAGLDLGGKPFTYEERHER